MLILNELSIWKNWVWLLKDLNTFHFVIIRILMMSILNVMRPFSVLKIGKVTESVFIFKVYQKTAGLLTNLWQLC